MEATEPFQKLIGAYLMQGVLRKCTSPCKILIFPVPKPRKDAEGKSIYSHLRLIKSDVIPQAPIVPNSVTIIPVFPASAKSFIIIDLCAVFFSILVDLASLYLFSFTWQNQQYTYTFLPQGSIESLTLFSQILKADHFPVL